MRRRPVCANRVRKTPFVSGPSPTQPGKKERKKGVGKQRKVRGGGGKGQKKTHNLQPPRPRHRSHIIRILIHKGEVPIRGGQTRERAHQRQKNHHEHHIGAHTTDQENQTHQPHKHEEKRKAGVKARLLEPRGIARVAHRRRGLRGVGDVGAVRVEPGHECGGEGEPEGAEGAEDDEGEGVADEEFADGAEDHEDAAEAEVDALF